MFHTIFLEVLCDIHESISCSWGYEFMQYHWRNNRERDASINSTQHTSETWML